MARTKIQILQNRLRCYHDKVASTPQAIAILDKMSKYTGRGMKTPHMTVTDGGEIWIEYFGPKRRLGIVLDANPAESSWFLIRLPLTADCGRIADLPHLEDNARNKNFDDIVRRFLQDT